MSSSAHIIQSTFVFTEISLVTFLAVVASLIGKTSMPPVTIKDEATKKKIKSKYDNKQKKLLGTIIYFVFRAVFSDLLTWIGVCFSVSLLIVLAFVSTQEVLTFYSALFCFCFAIIFVSLRSYFEWQIRAPTPGEGIEPEE